MVDWIVRSASTPPWWVVTLVLLGYYLTMLVYYRQMDMYYARMFPVDQDKRQKPRFRDNPKNHLLGNGSGLVVLLGLAYLIWVSYEASSWFVAMLTTLPYMGTGIAILIRRGTHKLEQQRQAMDRRHERSVTDHRLRLGNDYHRDGGSGQTPHWLS